MISEFEVSALDARLQDCKIARLSGSINAMFDDSNPRGLITVSDLDILKKHTYP
jgi:hypothetical protein